MLTGMYPAGFGCGAAMQQILDEDALPHVAAHVETQAGEITTTQTDHADPGGLGLQKHVDYVTQV